MYAKTLWRKMLLVLLVNGIKTTDRANLQPAHLFLYCHIYMLSGLFFKVGIFPAWYTRLCNLLFTYYALHYSKHHLFDFISRGKSKWALSTFFNAFERRRKPVKKRRVIAAFALTSKSQAFNPYKAYLDALAKYLEHSQKRLYFFLFFIFLF